MKKTWFALLLVLVLSLPCSVAYAADTTHCYIKELGIGVDIPSDMIVLTQSMAQDDPALVAYGADWNEIMEHLKRDNIFLDAFSPDGSLEIVITMMTDASLQSIDNFNQFTDSELLDLSKDWMEAYADKNWIVQRSAVYQHAQAKFFKVYFHQSYEGGTDYTLQYYTVINGQATNLTLHSYGQALTPELEALHQQVVDSAIFPMRQNAPAITAQPAFSIQGEMNRSMGLEEDASPSDLAASILTALLLTIALYSLPIIIYRYAVKKEPVLPKKARTITIVYGACALLVTLALSFYADEGAPSMGALFLWSFVNYKVLTGGKRKPAPGTPLNALGDYAPPPSSSYHPQPAAPAMPQSHQTRYCSRCGAPLSAGSAFCSRCGARVDLDGR